uniref:TATA-binding protein interacting (TIP20) domain-containing protein n=1 Tax=Strigamia maritima TaxID=126957 RepID=T1JM35_STRMM
VGEWPFETFCDKLSHDLFNPLWEIRHGSATALREIVRIHGKGAGKCADLSSYQQNAVNQLWLEDLSLRLICVLALDRFGDFLADQVVAPVRETCAQTLAAVLSIMDEDSVRGVSHVLLQLIEQKEWEARHGGLLGLKYLLAVRKEMTGELLVLVFNPLFKGLQDEVDDVCAVAASAFVPVVTDIILQLSDKVF